MYLLYNRKPEFSILHLRVYCTERASAVLHASFVAIIVSSNMCSSYFEGKVLNFFRCSSIFDTSCKEFNFNLTKFK